MNQAIKILHDTAMEFNDMGKLAGIKGEKSKKTNYLKIAYLLEKEAAMRYYAQKDNTLWRFGLLRSAGWLALQNGSYEEAQQLALLGLTGKVDAISKAELEELLAATQKKLQKKEKIATIPIYGTLSSADADLNVIKIREDGAQTYHIVIVPNHQILDVIKSYFGEVVEIQVFKDAKGMFILEQIKRAA